MNRKKIKLPGYWLKNFTKICVTMDFSANVSRNATSILVNHTAQSLYSVLHDEVNKTSPIDLPTIKTPPNIDKSCLIQGFNLPVTHPWIIRSRVALKSQQLNRCTLPYFLRGVGIIFPGVSCEEVIITNNSHPTIESYPVFCKIFIQ